MIRGVQLWLQALQCLGLCRGQLTDGAPRLAHPPNSLHLDRRYGVAVGPNQEQFTGDVVVITIEDTESSESTVFNVWSINDLGQVTCIDPIAAGGTYQQQTQKAYEGYSSKGAPSYGEGEYSSGWSPSLAHMFVVTVVDGRLGQFYLSPIVTFPQSPKYITPQPRVTRSGVASSIGSDGWALGEDEVQTVNTFVPPGEPFYGYSVGFYYDSGKGGYSYRDSQSGGGYGNTNKDGISGPYKTYSGNKDMKTMQKGYSSSSQYSSADSGYSAEGYEDGGRLAIRGSTSHEFCRCEAGLIKCFNVGQSFLSYPTQQNTVPVFGWFKMNKIPSQVARRQMENYQSAISGGLPRSFLLFTALPFTDRVDALHFHGAEALLSSRRVRLGMIRMTTRGTKLEQQATLVMRNQVSDTISFSISFTYIQGLFLTIGDLPVIPIFSPFSDKHKKSVMMNKNSGNPSTSGKKTEGSLGSYDDDQHIHFKTGSQARSNGKRTKTTMSTAPQSMYMDEKMITGGSVGDIDTDLSQSNKKSTMNTHNNKEDQKHDSSMMGMHYKKQDNPVTLPMSLVKVTSFLQSCFSGYTTTNSTYPGHALEYDQMTLFHLDEEIALHELEFSTKSMQRNCSYIHLPDEFRAQLQTRANRLAQNEHEDKFWIPANMTNSMTVGIQQQLLRLLPNQDQNTIVLSTGTECKATDKQKADLLQQIHSLKDIDKTLFIAALVASHYNSLSHADTIKVVDELLSQEGDLDAQREEAVKEATLELDKRQKTMHSKRQHNKKKKKSVVNKDVQKRTRAVNTFAQGSAKGRTEFGEKNLQSPSIWSDGAISLHTGATEQAVQEEVLEETDKVVKQHELKVQTTFSSSKPATNVVDTLSASRRFKTQQTNIPLIDSIVMGEELRFEFQWSFSTGSVIEFAGEYAMIVPPNTAHVGHVMQHLGYASMPFSQDMVRQDWFWNSQWVADMHLPADPVEVASNAGFSAFSTSFGKKQALFKKNSTGSQNTTLETDPIGSTPQVSTLHRSSKARHDRIIKDLKIIEAIELANKTASESNVTNANMAPFMSYAEAMIRKHTGRSHKAAVKTEKTCSVPESVFTSPELRLDLKSSHTKSIQQLSGENSCLDPFAGGMLADFTIRRASVEQDLYSLINPLGLMHPSLEQHHFAISGVYSATNTYFVEFVVERVS